MAEFLWNLCQLFQLLCSRVSSTPTEYLLVCTSKIKAFYEFTLLHLQKYVLHAVLICFVWLRMFWHEALRTVWVRICPFFERKEGCKWDVAFRNRINWRVTCFVWETGITIAGHRLCVSPCSLSGIIKEGRPATMILLGRQYWKCGLRKAVMACLWKRGPRCKTLWLSEPIFRIEFSNWHP